MATPLEHKPMSSDAREYVATARKPLFPEEQRDPLEDVPERGEST
jgi:hypothetical protein